ncbi:replicative DNA helicase [Desulfovibrio sp. OttesenSCG-928-I05]|nr:replicative DNA helicase [Desulfovibrio sp. OttesenSCG-928-I05]
MADELRHTPPHSVEAEQAVLGGLFLRAETLYILVDLLVPDDFYIPAHRSIYQACLELFRKTSPIELLSVAEQLKSMGELEAAGGAEYLGELAHSIISAANAEYYAGIVRDKSVARALINSCSSIISGCFDPTREVKELLDESEQAVFAVSERTLGRSFQNSRVLADKVFSDLANRLNHNDTLTGVTTGYTRLDAMTNGLQPSDLIIVAARPSMGKTAFVLNMAARAATRRDTAVAIYSLEMSAESLMQRMLCMQGKVDLTKLRKNSLSDDDWLNLQNSANVLREAPIFIDDTPAISPLELRARTRRLKAEHNVGLVIVDYLQLMRGNKRTDSREQEISEISRSLKAMAKELHVPVIALSQLNRKLEERKLEDRRPILSDLRESGAIEQDADVIMFIFREAAYLKAAERPPMDRAEIIIGKQRNGPVGMVELMYIPAYTAFEDMTTYAPAMEM